MSQPVINMWSQLSGCTEGREYVNKADAVRAITVLVHCADHKGRHHFVVMNEGHGIVCSPLGIACLKKAGL